MATSELKIIINGKDNASGVLKGFGNALGSIGKIAGGIIASQVITKVADTIFQVGKKAIDSTGNVQALQVGIEALVAREIRAADNTMKMGDALDAAGPKAKLLMDQLAKVAILSPFEKNVVDGTFKSAMAFGFATDEAVTFTKATLDVAAGVGANNEMLGRMGYNLAQIRLQNRVTAMDVRQLAMAGFDLVGMLKYVGKQMGVNIKDHNDFNAALESGKITWKDFTTLYAQYADENFGGASERMSRTLMGLKSTLSDVFELSMPQILTPSVEKVTEFANTILDHFLEIRESGDLEETGTKLGTSVGKILDPMSRVVTFFDVLKDPKMFRAGGDNVHNALVYAFGTEQGTQIEGFIDKITAAKDSALETFAPIIDAAKNLGAAFVESLPMLKQYGADMLSFLGGLGDAGGGGLISNIASTINSIAEIWRNHGPTIMAIVNFIWRTITTTISGAVLLISGIVAGLANFIGGAFDIIKSVLTGDFQGAFNALANTIGNGLKIAIDTATGFLDMALSIVGENLESFKETWRNNWEMLKEIVVIWWQNLKTRMIEGFNQSIENIVTEFETFKATWASNWEALKLIVSTFFSNLVESVRTKIVDFLAVGSDLIEYLKSGAISSYQGLRANIEVFIRSLVSAILSMGSQFASAGSELINRIKSGAESSFAAAIESVVGWAKDLIAAVRKAFEGFRITIPIGFSGGGTGGWNVPTSGGKLSSSQLASAARYAEMAKANKKARGGSFTVDGEPGVDRVPVMFWGTRGERVDVSSVGSSSRGSGGTVINVYEARNARETAAEIARILHLQGATL